MDKTRRQFLTYSTAMLATTASVTSALAQGAGGLAQSGLVGNLEGSEVVTDPARMPRTFKEAPELAALVQQNRLPPVAQRLPEEPLVLKPLNEVGRYGGTWRRGFVGPGDGENGNRINASDKLLFWDYSGNRIIPSVAKNVQMSADGKVTRVTLRKGMKWSDGHPFTADDFVFWFEDIYGNRELLPAGVPDMQPAGRPGRIVKVDEVTVEFQFDVPYFLFTEMLAGDTLIGAGFAVGMYQNRSFGCYAPKHYLSQFLPKYSNEAQVNTRARAEGFENWVRMIHSKKDWNLNPELPVIGPWRTTRPINTPTWAMERNPFYFAVDTDGNQLPYINQIVMSLAEDLEVLNLRAMSGQYDMQERHIDIAKLPVILENRDRGNYDLHLDLAFNGSDTTIHFNQSFVADAEIAKWLTNADFRRALSLAIDRNQMNETFWLGLGTPGSTVPAESMPQNPGPEWRNKWSTLDRAQANRMLDGLGLTRKDSEGYRLRTDNGQRLRLQIQTVRAFLPWPQQMEMVAQHWRQVGIFAEVREMERVLSLTRVQNNEHHIMVWTNGGTELLYLFPRHAIPVDPVEAYMGPEFAKWFASNGRLGREPTDPNIKRIFDLFNSAAGQQDEARNNTAKEIWKILADQVYSIGTVGQSPALMGVRLASRRLGNIPSRACIAQHCRTPGSSHPETFYYKS
jgi:peptide/nickel transport system substrate-binding protein